MTSQPDSGQITEPGLRGGAFFTGGSTGAFLAAGAFFAGGVGAGPFFAGGSFLAGGVGAAPFFGGTPLTGAFLALGAALAGFFVGGFLGAGRFSAGFFVAFCAFFGAGFPGLAARLPLGAGCLACTLCFFVVFVAFVEAPSFLRVVRVAAAFFDAAGFCAAGAMTTPGPKMAAPLAAGAGQRSAG
jgi:hypothetical protein